MCLCLCVCIEMRPELPQQAEASPPGSVHWCRPSVSVAPAGGQFIPRPNTPIPTGRPTGALCDARVCVRECVCLCVLISYWASCSAHDWLQTLLILSLGCIAECELHYNSGSKSMSALEAVKLLWGGRNVLLQFKTTTTTTATKKNPCV